MDNKELYLAVDFLGFCKRIIGFQTTTICNAHGDVHNNKLAWKTFMENEKRRYEALSQAKKTPQINVQKLDEIEYQFVAPWMARYDNAAPKYKETVLQLFVAAMYDKYFQRIFVNSEGE